MCGLRRISIDIERSVFYDGVCLHESRLMCMIAMVKCVCGALRGSFLIPAKALTQATGASTRKAQRDPIQPHRPLANLIPPTSIRKDDEEAQEIPGSEPEAYVTPTSQLQARHVLTRSSRATMVLLLRARLRRPQDPYLSPESQTLQMRSLRQAVKHRRR
jgi:hypothetical protein